MAGDARDALPGEAFADGLDSGDATGDGRFERESHAAFLGRGGEFRAMHGE